MEWIRPIDRLPTAKEAKEPMLIITRFAQNSSSVIYDFNKKTFLYKFYTKESDYKDVYYEKIEISSIIAFLSLTKTYNVNLLDITNLLKWELFEHNYNPKVKNKYNFKLNAFFLKYKENDKVKYTTGSFNYQVGKKHLINRPHYTLPHEKESFFKKIILPPNFTPINFSKLYDLIVKTIAKDLKFISLEITLRKNIPNRDFFCYINFAIEKKDAHPTNKILRNLEKFDMYLDSLLFDDIWLHENIFLGFLDQYNQIKEYRKDFFTYNHSENIDKK